MTRRQCMSAALAAMAIATAACGPLPPQAPLAAAKRLDAATSGISTACGEAYQVTAFAGDHAAGLAALEATAGAAAVKLAGVYARNPSWIYQGQTVRQIVLESIDLMRSCSLSRPAGILAQRTAGG
jgi:hypothetical protein